MNRKQLEECAWKKTPTDERRAQKERYDWKTKKTATERLKGNNREVRVFDPSGDTPGTMSPWVPLWSLYSDELEQRCKEEREPKLRPPYNRTRADYTGDVESSPGGTRTAARRSGPAHHATKKSYASQGRWDDSPGAWQRGYDFAKEAMLHEMRAEQREILNRVAKSASSSYDYGFLAAYQDAFGVSRSRSHATKKRAPARYWKVVRVDLITKEETLVAANFSTKADAEEAALAHLAASKSTKYMFKPKVQGSKPIRGPHDTY